MYELDASKLKNQKKRLAKLLEVYERAPVVQPLGPDRDGVYHYNVTTLKEDGEVSEHIVSLADSKHGKPIAGCLCYAGTVDKHCFHVAAALPVHTTYEIVYRDIRSWSGQGMPTPVAHLRAVI